MAFLLTQCSSLSPTNKNANSSTQTKRFANLDGNVLIDLPSSIATTKQTQGLHKTTANHDATPEDAIELYDGIREWIGYTDALVHNDTYGVKALITFWRDTLNWAYIEQVGEVSGIEGEYKWTGSFSESRPFAYHLMIQKTSVTGEPVALKIEFNGDFDYPAGKVYYNVDLLDPNATNQAELLIEFEKTADIRSLDLSISADEVLGTENEEFQKGKLSLRESGGIVHISGSSYHPNIDSIFPGVTGHCYTFTGVVDTAANQAIIKLGLPPAHYQQNDNTLFTTYGIANAFMSSIMIQEIPLLNDTLKRLLVTSYKDSMSVEQLLAKIALTGSIDFLHEASEIVSMTNDDFMYLLKINENISDPEARADIASILWISALEQPVYFNSIGYVGNGSVVPSGFGNLASIDCSIAPFAPSSVRDLTIIE